MTSTPELADPELLGAHDLARSALLEITPDATIGAPMGYTLEADGVVSLQFASAMEGYPGWVWTVSLARVADADPTVLEVELLPGAGALLAPEWVPWAERLAVYQAQQARDAAEAAEAAAELELDDDVLDDDDDDDDDVLDDDVDDAIDDLVDDLDGVDIDELDADANDDDDADEDDDEDDDDVDEDDDDDDSDETDEDDEDESDAGDESDEDD